MSPANTFKIKIVTPEEEFLQTDAVSLIAPGELGYLGILCNHAPLVTPLVKGTLTLKESAKPEKTYEIDGGFLEVNNNTVTLLIERIKETASQPAS